MAAAFRYDAEDIARARRNEELAARHGLRAEIENPLHRQAGGDARLPELDAGRAAPAGGGAGLWDDLAPLAEMAHGAPNTAERLRARLQAELG